MTTTLHRVGAAVAATALCASPVAFAASAHALESRPDLGYARNGVPASEPDLGAARNGVPPWDSDAGAARNDIGLMADTRSEPAAATGVDPGVWATVGAAGAVLAGTAAAGVFLLRRRHHAGLPHPV